MTASYVGQKEDQGQSWWPRCHGVHEVRGQSGGKFRDKGKGTENNLDTMRIFPETIHSSLDAQEIVSINSLVQKLLIFFLN